MSRGKEPVIHIDFNNRPIVAICGCGKVLRGRTETLPADRVYWIDGEKVCRRCGLNWFNRQYEITDVL